jgi:lipoate-protein ligase B
MIEKGWRDSSAPNNHWPSQTHRTDLALVVDHQPVFTLGGMATPDEARCVARAGDHPWDLRDEASD